MTRPERRARLSASLATLAITLAAARAGAVPVELPPELTRSSATAYGATRRDVVALRAPATVSVPVEIPDGARVLSAFAVPSGPPHQDADAQAVDLRIDLETEGETLAIYERRIDVAREPRDRRWFDVGRAVGPLAGRRGTLRFTVAPVGAGAGTVVLWAVPELASCADEGPSLLLVVLDAMRGDRLSAAGYPRPTTPYLDAFAGDATRFAAAFSAGPKTIPSIPQLLTGAYFYLHRAGTGLESLLGGDGYARSRAVVNNPHVAPWLAAAHPGFQTVVAGELDARTITSEALRYLSAAGRCRTALYLHYLDTHTPYRPPPRYARRFIDPTAPTTLGLAFDDVTAAWSGRLDEADRRRVSDLYDAAIAATDRQLGRLFRGVRRRHRLARTIVVVTADHGEELWDRGRFFHGQSLYDELLHVPLVIRFPDAGHGSVVDEVVSTVDILPTVVDAAGLPGVESDGMSLRGLATGDVAPTARDRVVFATVSHAEPRTPQRHGVRTRDRKVIRNVEDGLVEVYDLVADPGERRNLGAAAPGARELLATLDTVRLQIADAGVQMRVRATSAREVRYVVTLAGDPPVPIVGTDRLTLERGETFASGPRSSVVTLQGAVGADDEDRVRMDILARTGTLKVKILIDGAPAPAGVLRLGRSAHPAGDAIALDDPVLVGAPPDAVPSVTDAAVDAPPLVVSLWRAEAIAGRPPGADVPPIDEAERARLRALGYVD